MSLVDTTIWTNNMLVVNMLTFKTTQKPFVPSAKVAILEKAFQTFFTCTQANLTDIATTTIIIILPCNVNK